MSDIYSRLEAMDTANLDDIAQRLERRAADARYLAMREEFLAAIRFPTAARVLEIGCGTGVVCRALAVRAEIAEVVRLELSAGLLDRAREFAGGLTHVSFVHRDGRDVPLPDASFDVVLFHNTLCHLSGAERAIAQAFRLLKRTGWLAAFEGDYASTTIAIGSIDPLQCCAEAAMAALINDPWLARRLPCSPASRLEAAPVLARSGRTHGVGEEIADGWGEGLGEILGCMKIGRERHGCNKMSPRKDASQFFGHGGWVSCVHPRDDQRRRSDARKLINAAERAIMADGCRSGDAGRIRAGDGLSHHGADDRREVLENGCPRRFDALIHSATAANGGGVERPAVAATIGEPSHSACLPARCGFKDRYIATSKHADALEIRMDPNHLGEYQWAGNRSQAASSS